MGQRRNASSEAERLERGKGAGVHLLGPKGSFFDDAEKVKKCVTAQN